MKPYTTEQWQAILGLGKAVDARMRSDSLNLTMGAEPTYVMSDAHSPEWTTEALGPTKLEVGRRLMQRLLRRFAPQGWVQEGQGKWYPGESLPRWALRCQWLPQLPWTTQGTPQAPESFLSHLAHQLGLQKAEAQTTQDGRHWVWVLGWEEGQGWRQAPWPQPPCLLETEGSAGMRLPWNELPAEHPCAQLGTALCLEQDGDGFLRVFLPPLARVEAWLELMRALHSSGALLRLEGYPPPLPDLQSEPLAGLKTLSITPDPGVLEVNLHPASHWEELVEIVTGVDQEARQCGLMAHRFWRDGNQIGTGGGCHVVVGGAAPRLSPFAQKPEFLRSILLFWNRHPALAYFFSGLFVGPTCQAPRVDEARHDALYELELAFRALEGPGSPDPATLGRMFRDLLVDVSGNGHRSEICVDKLFDPIAPGGQQGLLEFRAMEMSPEPSMTLVLMLFLRCLLSYLWTHPQQGDLRRFGTELHDRYMLPTYLWQDLESMVAELHQAGIPFQLEWLRPQLELRFPLLGQCKCQGVTLQLRGALEPWPVLGESQGGSRPVDSSVQRVEVRLLGLDLKRFRVACNGQFLPLQPIGPGEYLSAVRFRAWQFHQSLHPTLGIQSPLQFDLVGTDGVSRGVCRYHTRRPDGEAWEDFPADSQEASRRRQLRFQTGWHKALVFDWSEPYLNREYPCTLDLRLTAVGQGGVLAPV